MKSKLIILVQYFLKFPVSILRFADRVWLAHILSDPL